MPLPKIGVEAVVDNLDGYKKAMKAVDTANENAGKGVEATAKKFNVLMFAADALGDTMQQAFGNIIGGVVLGALNAVGNLIGGLIGRIQGLVSSIFNAGVDFSKTMANISSVTKLTGNNLTQLGKDLIEIGADSAAGPQAVAAAYYDVASGVLDASKRMDVLRASIALSEAGQADLTASTQGLISVMNAYGDARAAQRKYPTCLRQPSPAASAQWINSLGRYVPAGWTGGNPKDQLLGTRRRYFLHDREGYSRRTSGNRDQGRDGSAIPQYAASYGRCGRLARKALRPPFPRTASRVRWRCWKRARRKQARISLR
jgi:hypothetical protein